MNKEVGLGSFSCLNCNSKFLHLKHLQDHLKGTPACFMKTYESLQSDTKDAANTEECLDVKPFLCHYCNTAFVTHAEFVVHSFRCDLQTEVMTCQKMSHVQDTSELLSSYFVLQRYKERGVVQDKSANYK